FLEMTTSKIEELSFKTIYGDTDSVFVLSKAKTLNEAEKIGKRIEREINSFYDEFVKREYERPNYLKLEFEKLYEKFYLPKQRHIEAGAKKRYAGLMRGELDIVGLEYVRRDWTELAKKFQYNLLFKVFHKEDYKTYIKEFIDDLKKGDLDELLVYKKGVRKELKRYTKTTPPHVKAARKLENFKDRMISYVMTKNGPEPLERITSKIDYSHYIEKQLKPIADSILTFYEESFEDILAGSRQMKLGDFL
ncbi:MAG: DNA polymerase domain-containing protein, partial [Candidatus Methanofastidiosia archaeon]